MDYKAIMESAASYVAEEKPKAGCPGDIANLIRPLCQALTQETFYVLNIDTKHCVIRIVEATKGLVDRSQVHAREVFRQAIIDNASRVILCHNHPSGDPSPSSQDITVTKHLVAAGKIIGIEVLDHVIMGKKTPTQPKDFLSLKEENML